MSKIKKLLSLVTASFVFITSISYTTYAEEAYEENNPLSTYTADKSEVENLYLIEEKETVLDNGFSVKERFYSDVPDDGISLCSINGTRTIRNEKDISHDGILVVTMYVQADFEWNTQADTAVVIPSSIETGYHYYYSANVKIEESIDYGSNQGFTWGLGYKYAYVRYFVDIYSYMGSELHYDIYIDCNVRGVASRA